MPIPQWHSQDRFHATFMQHFFLFYSYNHNQMCYQQLTTTTNNNKLNSQNNLLQLKMQGTKDPNSRHRHFCTTSSIIMTTRAMCQLLGNDEYCAPVRLLHELPRLQCCCRLRGVCPLNLGFNETSILNSYRAVEHTVGQGFLNTFQRKRTSSERQSLKIT